MLYDDGTTRIDDTAITFGGITLAPAQVVSVRVERKQPTRAPVALIVGGLLFAAILAAASVGFALAVALLSSGAGALWLRFAKPAYAIRLEAASGRVYTVWANDAAVAEQLRAAILATLASPTHPLPPAAP